MYLLLDVLYITDTSVDHHETFVEHFKLELTALLSDKRYFLVNLSQNLVNWEVEFYSLSHCENNACVLITLRKSKQTRVNLAANFDFKTQNSAYTLRKPCVIIIRRFQKGLLLNLTSHNNIVNSANRLLDADNKTFTVRMRVSCVINSQHNIVTSPPQFVILQHKTVDI